MTKWLKHEKRTWTEQYTVDKTETSSNGHHRRLTAPLGVVKQSNLGQNVSYFCTEVHFLVLLELDKMIRAGR